MDAGCARTHETESKPTPSTGIPRTPLPSVALSTCPRLERPVVPRGLDHHHTATSLPFPAHGGSDLRLPRGRVAGHLHQVPAPAAALGVVQPAPAAHHGPDGECNVSAVYHLVGRVVKRPPLERLGLGSKPAFPLGFSVFPVTEKLVLQWPPCRAPGVMASALGLAGLVSEYCDRVR